MAEFIGTDLQIDLQKRLLARCRWIADTPEVAHGGRLLGIIDPERLGWSRAVELAEEDGIGVFTALPFDATMDRLKRFFGQGWRLDHWNIFLGQAPAVLDSCRRIVDGFNLPAGWLLETLECPDDARIDDIQKMNIENGIAPYPAYYMRGELVPCSTTVLKDDRGVLIATASANMRYHPKSRFAHHVFAGSVAVHRHYRGRGLGKLLNAEMLLKSHERYSWVTALEQVKPDNLASRAMIEACGLVFQPDLATIAAIRSDEDFTR